MKATLAYNYSVEEGSQDPKAIAGQENRDLEMELLDRWQLVSSLYAPPSF